MNILSPTSKTVPSQHKILQLDIVSMCKASMPIPIWSIVKLSIVATMDLFSGINEDTIK